VAENAVLAMANLHYTNRRADRLIIDNQQPIRQRTGSQCLSKQRFLRLEGVANVQGIASLPVKRLERKLGELPKDVFEQIKRAVAFAWTSALSFQPATP